MIQFQNDLITVFQSELFQTTSTVIQTPDLVLIVDPNWLKGEVERIRDYVAQIRGDRPLYLLFTHSDWDHIIGFNAFPDATTIGSIHMQQRTDPESAVKQIVEFDAKNYITRDYATEFPRLDVAIQEDGQQLCVGGTTLTFYHAWGHIADGLFTIVEEHGILIAGDYLSNVEYPYIYQSSTLYEQTMHRVEQVFAEHNIQLLVPGHGQVTTDREEMIRRQASSLHYIQVLRQAVQDNDYRALDELSASYPYDKGTKNFYKDNVELVKRELGLNE